VTPVLLDTGCIVALLDRSEASHPRCVETLRDLSGPLVTCEAVIAEACYLLRGLRGAADAVLENVERGIFGIPFRLDAMCAQVRTLRRRYVSVPMDLADACLVTLATELGTGRILTLDRDFEVYRWGRNRPFELLVPLEPAG
jgi:uncharacterized protein